jgi:malonyl-CoA decarboxylase
VLPPEATNTAIFYSINNCRSGLRGIPFGNFLIKQVVTELAAELPKIKIYSTLSPLPRFARALRDQQNEHGFTRDRLGRLLSDFSEELTATAGCTDSVEALFRLLEDPVEHRRVLTKPLERLALAYIAQARKGGKLYDPVATFHLSNGARLERINAFGNQRLYGMEASFGVTVNYRYPPADLEENHERFVRHGQSRVSSHLYREYRVAAEAWRPTPVKSSVRAAR